MAKKRKSSKNNSSKSNSRNKITKYRKPLNVNIGMIIFSVIFFYVVISVIMYFQTSHIVRYEVEEGSLATNNIYTNCYTTGRRKILSSFVLLSCTRNEHISQAFHSHGS